MVDVRKVAEQLIAEMWLESDKLREKAEGVRALYERLLLANDGEGQQSLEADEQKKKEEETSGSN
jgi:hypothetical protein